MIYEDKTELLRGGLFAVQNDVGLGHGEEAYHKAYKAWLKEHKIPFVSKTSHCLNVGDNLAYTLHPDFVVWNCITIELKAVARRLHSEELVQLFDYLKCRGDRVGLLVNMGLNQVYTKRIVYEPVKYLLCEDWKNWSNIITGEERKLGTKVRQAIVDVFEQHGSGYGRKVTEKLLGRSLRNRKCEFVTSPVGTAYYHHKVVDKSHLDCLVIDDKIMVTFTALFDDNKFNISRGQSFLKTLGLKWGISVNFGKSKLEIKSLCNA